MKFNHPRNETKTSGEAEGKGWLSNQTFPTTQLRGSGFLGRKYFCRCFITLRIFIALTLESKRECLKKIVKFRGHLAYSFGLGEARHETVYRCN